MSVKSNSYLDKSSLSVALACGAASCFLPRLYGQLGRAPKSVSIFIPLSCATLAVISWRTLVAKPLQNWTLQCPACAAIRGSAIAAVFGCFLPSVAIAASTFKRKPNMASFKTLEKLFEVVARPYTAEKPYILGVAGLQGILGYGLASWKFSEQLEQRLSQQRDNL